MGALKRLGLSENEIPGIQSKAQAQTKEIFAFKWKKRDTYESAAVKEMSRNWLLERYAGNDPDFLKKLLATIPGKRKIILDAGTGSGHSALLLWKNLMFDHDYLCVDISDAVWVAKERFYELQVPADFLKADILNLPIPNSSVDVIFSEGVLHHTDNTERAIKYLAEKIKPGGYFLFYVYAKKGPIREFTDDYIRSVIKPLGDDEAWQALEPLSKLGISLGQSKLTIEVPEDIPILGIKKGQYDLQRFFYWNIFKAFYRPEMNLDEMNHINFDWFRPLNCHRQTPEEVTTWCKDSGLEIEHMNIQESGITVRAKKL